MQDALYGGADGFYRRHRGADHFRTSASAAPGVLARAVRTLASRVDAALGHPSPFDVVDVGAGDGALLSALASQPDLPDRWSLTAVELGPRPVGVPDAVAWLGAVPPLSGLLLASEWLDVVPVEVLFDGRVVEVEPDGRERLGGPAGSAALAWAARWWPAGRRVEVGLARDSAWADAVAQVRQGVAVAADYAHVLGVWRHDFGALERAAWGDRRPTLTGYRDGRQVPPLPDGSCDLTAHVAIDACREAGGGGRLLTQRAALQSLGVDATPPPRALADRDPHGYLAALRDAGAAAELLDPRGLGGFAWLVRCAGVADPFTGASGSSPG